MKFLLVFFFVNLISSALGYKILCIFGPPSKSSDHLASGIVRPLLEAGHEVTLATTFPENKNATNLRVISLAHIRKVLKTRSIGRQTADTEELREVVVKEQFDAVITMWFLNDFEAGYAAIQQVPWIMLSTIGMHTYLELLLDEPRAVPTVPLALNHCDVPMTTWRRMRNGIMHTAMVVFSWFDHYALATHYEETFAPLAAARGVPLPPFSEVQRNISILFLNGHESISPAQPLPPNAINIAGYHIDDNIKPLPKDLQELMDKSTQGVIYFSMGSIVRSADISPSTREALLRMFATLPYTVLWKFEEPLQNLPKNVHVRSWMPQPSILAHPNVRLFITHGGLLSTLEAIHAGVPLVAVPVFGDQPSNAQRAARAGYALKVDYRDNEEMVEELRVALNKMLGSDTYYNKAKYLSKIFRTRPTKPADLVKHYVELAIETKGAPHLRSLSHQYSWYERQMLDLALLLLVMLAVLVWLVKRIYRLIGFGRKKNDTKQKKGAAKKKN